MSLPIHVDAADPTPPYEQLRAQIAAAIGTGQLAPGTKLPPMRQLARDLGVATGTVGRAYKELEQAGLVATARRAGTTVVGPARATPAGALGDLASVFVTRARALGCADAAIAAAVGEALRGAPPP